MGVEKHNGLHINATIGRTVPLTTLERSFEPGKMYAITGVNGAGKTLRWPGSLSLTTAPSASTVFRLVMSLILVGLTTSTIPFSYPISVLGNTSH